MELIKPKFTSYSLHDSSLPPSIQHMIDVMEGTRSVDYKFTYQPSILPVVSESIVSTCLDHCGMLWAATSDRIIRFAPNSSDRRSTQRIEINAIKGSIKLLQLIDEHV
mgnify:CR=1 FL=1